MHGHVCFNNVRPQKFVDPKWGAAIYVKNPIFVLNIGFFLVFLKLSLRNRPRVVVNYLISETVEQYYQEVGRGGRDGQPAYGYLLYTNQSKRGRMMLLNNSQ